MSTYWESRSIKAKLLLAIGSILAVFALSCSIVLLFVSGLAASADRALNHEAPARSAAFTTQINLLAADSASQNYIMDNSASTASLSTYNDNVAAVKDALPKLLAAAETVEGHDAITKLTTWFDGYTAANEHAFALKRSGKRAQSIKESLRNDTATGEQLITTFIGLRSARMTLAAADVDAKSRAAIGASIAGASGSILIGAIIAFVLGGAISKRLAAVTQAMTDVVRVDFAALGAAMTRFGAGDFTASVSSNREPLAVTGKDETAALAQSYNAMLAGINDFGQAFAATSASLTATITEIKESAEVVSVSAREIATGNGDLSQRTEEQAASLEETAASMEQFTSTVNQNGENAKQANTLAIGARNVAAQGGTVVGEVVETMAAINASAKKIVDIISVIDGIAFQTNILALNAAVEAARAGEQGRGFAVVAGEVRTLAQRSAEAAKEIKQLISDSVEKTDAGTKLVGQAGETMAEIVSSVQRVTDIMAAIAEASIEQSNGIGQVNSAVAQLDQVTQQNAALVEEIAASAEALQERAGGLVDSVSIFTIARSTSAPRAALAKKSDHHQAAAPAAPKKRTTPQPAVAHQPHTAALAVADKTPEENEAWNSF